MIFYRLEVVPGEGEPEGEDQDEWFTSLREAKARRREILGLGETKGLAIDQVVIDAKKPLRRLLLSVFNRSRFIETRRTVVPSLENEASRKENDS